MAKVTLGINASFAVGRFPEPEVWLEIVGKRLGVRHVQFFADLIDPKVEEKTRERMCARTREAAAKNQVTMHSVFSGTITHWMHTLLHPDADMRRDARDWYESYIRMTPLLGARAVGSMLGSFSQRDMESPDRKAMILEETLRAWQDFSRLGKAVGLDYLMLEPMSIPREIPCTIEETEELYEKFNTGMAIPTRLCMDIGHGARVSGKEEDRDPYAWIRRFGARTPVIHVQQTDEASSKHWPFTEDYNRRGRIRAEEVLEAVEASGAEEVLLAIEVFHSFYEPMDRRVIEDLEESVAYWRRYVPD